MSISRTETEAENSETTYLDIVHLAQIPLDPRRRDILTRANDEILVSSQHIKTALLIKVPLIARFNERHSVLFVTGLVCHSHISLENRKATQMNLADFASAE